MEIYEAVYRELHKAADSYGIEGVRAPQIHQRRRFQFREKIALLLAKDVLENKPSIDDHCIPINGTRASLSSATQRPDEAIRDAVRDISRRTGYKIKIKLQ